MYRKKTSAFNPNGVTTLRFAFLEWGKNTENLTKYIKHFKILNNRQQLSEKK